MLAEGLQHFFTDLPLTILGLILFLVAHASLVGRVFLKRDDKFVQESLLPFSDEESPNERR